MNWSDPVSRAIAIHEEAWRENTARMVRAARRAVDDILDPVKAEKRRILRRELLARLENLGALQRLAKRIQEERLR